MRRFPSQATSTVLSQESGDERNELGVVPSLDSSGMWHVRVSTYAYHFAPIAGSDAETRRDVPPSPAARRAAAAIAETCVLASGNAPRGRWLVVWRDEFAGPAGALVDTARWRYDTGDGCPGSCGWGNSEKEFYTSDTANIALNGQGQLAITARVATDTIPCYYGRCLYKSAKITTRGKMSVSPGRVEARIKLAAGQGLWPAFWLLGNNIGSVGWPTCGELDIMENKGSQPTTTSSAVHGPGYSGNTPFAHSHGPIVTTDYHIYAVEWDTQSIRYFVDGTQHYIVTQTNVLQHGKWVFDQPFFVILNLAVGGHFDHDPQSNAIFPATILVDYVRVYKAVPAK